MSSLRLFLKPQHRMRPNISFVAMALAVAMTALAGCSGNQQTQKLRYFENGEHYASEGKFREAVIEYRNAVQIDPMFGQARAKLAQAYEKVGDGPNALREYIRAADLLPENIDLQLTAGGYLIAARRVDDALARADGVIARQPNNVEAHVLRGNALAGLNEFDQALTEMEEALRLDPTRGATYTQLGLVESARGRQGEAEVAFKRAVELAPTWVGGRLALANLFWATGRLSEAEEALTFALKLAPLDEDANHSMAVFSLATGRVREAEKYLRQLTDVIRTPASFFSLSDYYIATLRSAEAISILTPMAADSRTSSEARPRLARAYAAAGSYDKAHKLIDEILSKDPRNVETQLLKGQLLLEANRRDEAIESVKAAVVADPSSAAAQFTLGRVHAARGDVAGAEAAFREVLKINPSASAAQTELSLLQLSSGTVTASLHSAEAAVKGQPGRLEPRLALIRSLLAAREFDRAGRELQPLLAAYPKVAAVHVQRGVLAASRNQLADARATFEEALQLDSSSLEALSGLLALDLNAKNFAAAKERVSRRLESPPVTTGLLLLAARTYGSVNELESAERVLRRAINVDPTLLSAYSMLGQIYLGWQKLDEARLEFDNLAKRQSNPVGALTMSGMILQAQGNHAEARLRFEGAMAADPRAAVAANNLAWLYAESGEKLGDALRFARTAAAVLPESPEVLDTLGWVYYKSEMPALAIPPLMRCVEMLPGNAEYRYHLGLAYLKAGDEVHGRESLARALALSRDAAWADEARRAIGTIDQSNRR